jgi:hypothetical protein
MNRNARGRVMGGTSGHRRRHQWIPYCVAATLSNSSHPRDPSYMIGGGSRGEE